MEGSIYFNSGTVVVSTITSESSMIPVLASFRLRTGRIFTFNEISQSFKLMMGALGVGAMCKKVVKKITPAASSSEISATTILRLILYSMLLVYIEKKKNPSELFTIISV